MTTSTDRTLRPGQQLASTTCSTRVVVVRAPDTGSPVITCGGSPMVPATPSRGASGPVPEAVTQVGKRYVDAGQQLELLCTASGVGSLGCDGEPMTVKAAKPLPASD